MTRPTRWLLGGAAAAMLATGSAPLSAQPASLGAQTEPPVLHQLPDGRVVPLDPIGSVVPMAPRPLEGEPLMINPFALTAPEARVPPAPNAGVGAVRIFEETARLQTRSSSGAVNVVPTLRDPSALNWLPQFQVRVPARDEVVAPALARPVEVRLIPIETVNRWVADGRGNDGMVVGLSFTLPWMIP